MLPDEDLIKKLRVAARRSSNPEGICLNLDPDPAIFRDGLAASTISTILSLAVEKLIDGFAFACSVLLGLALSLSLCHPSNTKILIQPKEDPKRERIAYAIDL